MKRQKGAGTDNPACTLEYAGKTAEKKVLSVKAAHLETVKVFGRPDGWANLLISGDNLPVLKALMEDKAKGVIRNSDKTGGVRLAYIDPPFSTNLSFKGRQSAHAYDDKLTGSDFVEYVRQRLILIRELLSEDGSVFVHLDWKKVHYIKAVMDEVFGEENFLNDIIWSYGGRGAKAIASQFSRNHDIILWYAKSPRHVFSQLLAERRIKKGSSGFRQDPEGRWYKTSPRGDYTDESIEKLKKDGRVHVTRGGKVRIKYFVREEGGHIVEDKLVGDVWDDIPDAMHLPLSEKTGYPTQKPEALLSRIILCASNPGDLVLDAFAGSGTTLGAAEKLGRRWIGIDSGRLAVHTMEKRLLAISASRDPLHHGRRYNKVASPFLVLEGGHSHPEPGLKVKSRYSYDSKKDECVIRIDRVEGPDGASGKDTLSTVQIDYSFDGEVFSIDEALSSEELKNNGYEIRFPASKAEGQIMVVYADAAGNEKWFVGEVG